MESTSLLAAIDNDCALRYLFHSKKNSKWIPVQSEAKPATID